MKQRVLVATVVVAALVGASALVFRAVLGDERATERAGASASRADTGERAPTRNLEEDAPPAATVTVTALTGVVEVSHAGGPWRPAVVGEALSASDVIRTSVGCGASLKVGEAATVQLDESSQVGVSEISRTVSSVRLEGGRLSARVRGEGGSRFRVEVRGSDAVAETGAGEFAVLTDERGRVTVASTEGDVTLSARGKSVVVAAEQLATVAPDAAPSSPRQIPPSLFLKVGKPRSLVQREKQLEVVGETTPGAVISINGVRVDVGEDGSFATTVSLVQGANAITVRAEDVLGRRQQEQTRVTVDTSTPKVKTGVTWEQP